MVERGLFVGVALGDAEPGEFVEVAMVRPFSPPLLTRAIRSRRREALERGLWVIAAAIWLDLIAWLIARLCGAP